MPQEITRHHLDVGGRRVHYRRTGQGPPVMMLHESPRSSAALLALMAYGPRDVTMLAFDTPGNGLSEPLALAKPDAGDYGDALAATLDALHVPRAVVYGTHTGAAIGVALACRHPQRVARLVLDGIGVFDAAERAQVLDSYLPPFVPTVDGTHLAWLWARVRDQMMFFPWNHRGTGARLWRPLPQPEALHALAMDMLMAGDAYRAPYIAAFCAQPAQELQHVTVPTLVAARQDDVLLPHLARLPALPPHIRSEHLSADRALWGARLWAELRQGAAGLPDAPPTLDSPLPAARLGDTLAGAAGRRIHLRGAMGGAGGRPLVWLHPSPGGARGMDGQLQPHVGRRPVIAPDLPGHGESDDFGGDRHAALLALHETLRSIGIDEADICGEGLGGALAQMLCAAYPARYLAGSFQAPSQASRTGVPAPPALRSRADGGHLAAAWLHARDEAILGPWWSRKPGDRHDFGDALDVDTIHRRCIEYLKEAPSAAALRTA